MIIEFKWFTDDEVSQAVCRQYWSVNEDGDFIYSTNELVELYKMNTPSLYKMVKESCSIFLPELVCPSCNTKHSCNTRTEFKKLIKKPYTLCQRCQINQREKERLIREELRREKELELFQKEKSQRQYLIENLANCKKDNLDFSELTSRNIIFLMSLIRFCADEQMTYFRAYSEVRGITLTPSSEYSLELLKELFRKNLILISPESELSSFIWNDDNTYEKFYLSKVEWLVNSKVPLYSIYSEIEKIIYEDNFLQKNYNEIKEICEEVALQECLSYLYFQLNRRNFEFSAGEKTIAVFRAALEHYSVSQIYSFIYRACQYASDKYQMGDIPKKHAVNLIPGSIQRSVERAIAEGWDVKPYKRDFNLPQSELSAFLYDGILKESDGGFTKTSKDLLSDYGS